MNATAYATMAAAARNASRKDGTVAVRLEGRNLVVSTGDADRLQASGRPFAFLSVRFGMLMTVPANVRGEQ
jgi:hypothetical protein